MDNFLNPKIATLIMAAGASMRMGKPKQLLPWGETNLLDYIISEVKKSRAKDIFLVLGANYDLISKSVDTVGIEVLKNKNWKNGLGSSISFGTGEIQKKQIDFSGFLIVLGDQPQVDHNCINNLIKLFKGVKNQIIATKYFEGLGVPAIFGKAYIPEIIRLNLNVGAKEIINKNLKNTTIYIPRNELIDIDTPETYNRLYTATFESNEL